MVRGRARLVIVVIIGILLAVSLYAALVPMESAPSSLSSTTTSPTTVQTSVLTSNAPGFAFNDQKALGFLQRLSTPSGLLQVFPGSNTIYLSDDQQLDYAALMKLGDHETANRINETLRSVIGGLYGAFDPTRCIYGNWNGADVVLGAYLPIPCGGSEWNLLSGQDFNYSMLPHSEGFQVKETKWSGPMGSGYTQYADLQLYYSIYQLHAGNYSEALKAFADANSMWDGNGFADVVFQGSHVYTSYDLALDLIAYRGLADNSHTRESAALHLATINQVANIMSELQAADGGVITNYLVTNGGIQVPPNTYENGETTSLFVIAH